MKAVRYSRNSYSGGLQQQDGHGGTATHAHICICVRKEIQTHDAWGVRTTCMRLGSLHRCCPLVGMHVTCNKTICLSHGCTERKQYIPQNPCYFNNNNNIILSDSDDTTPEYDIIGICARTCIFQREAARIDVTLTFLQCTTMIVERTSLNMTVKRVSLTSWHQ